MTTWSQPRKSGGLGAGLKAARTNRPLRAVVGRGHQARSLAPRGKPPPGRSGVPPGERPMRGELFGVALALGLLLVMLALRGRRVRGLGSGETVALDNVTLFSERLKLVGRPDRIVRDGGHFIPEEWKTAKRVSHGHRLQLGAYFPAHRRGVRGAAPLRGRRPGQRFAGRGREYRATSLRSPRDSRANPGAPAANPSGNTGAAAGVEVPSLRAPRELRAENRLDGTGGRHPRTSLRIGSKSHTQKFEKT